MSLEFVLKVYDQLPEVLLVIQNQLRNDCLVNLSGWELILGILDDYCCQLGEVFRDLGCAFFHNDDVLISQLQQEVRVALDTREQ